MGGLKGGGGGSTTTTPAIPRELSQLFQTSSNRVLDAQNQNPLTNFTQSAAQIASGGGGPVGGSSGSGKRGGAVGGSSGFGKSGNNVNNGGGGPTVDAPFQTSQRAGQFGQAQQEIERGRSIGAGFGEQQRTSQGLGNALGAQTRAGVTPETYGQLREQTKPGLNDLINRGDRRVDGQGITSDPAYQQAIRAFESTILPQIQNSAAQSGLGRSTGLQQSIAAGQAQYLLPVIQDTLARQERSIDRGLGARQFEIQTQNELGLQQANAEDRAIGRDQQASQFASGLLSNAGSQQLAESQRARDLQFTQNQNAISQLGNLGQSEQAYTQGALDRNTQDFLRRQSLAEQSLFTPFGGTASSIGQNVQSTQGGKKGKG